MKKTKFKELLITQNKIYKDKRGYFKELLRENKLNKRFPFVVMSFSKKKCNQRFAFTKKKFTRKICNSYQGENF